MVSAECGKVQPARTGRLKRVRDTNGPGTTYWEHISSDARERFGGAARERPATYSAFDAVDGGLRSRTTGTSGAIQNLSYDWDKVGNLTMRRDNTLNLTERFYYDALNRLDYSTLNGTFIYAPPADERTMDGWLAW